MPIEKNIVLPCLSKIPELSSTVPSFAFTYGRLSRYFITVSYGGDLGHLGGYSCGYRAPAFRIHGPWDMK